ncbi:MAG: phage terminase large subunit [Clostridia bacterium]|nr:phage terminase large subunit [Clostridia bacterium]
MTKIQRYLRTVKPYPKQEEFFEAKTTRVAYGGARGGGKSWAMRTKFILLALAYPGIQILLLRRTFPELRENHIIPLQKALNGIAQYKDSTKEFTFKNRSRIKLGYCLNESDILQYQGQAYEVIGMEEATQFTYMQYIALTESNRLSGNTEGFVPRMYFTCNPGGVGHEWVKRLFIDKRYNENENAEDYTFVPSTVYDNEYIISKNPQYVKTLEALPPLRRKAMLYGDWDAFEGQYFPEFSREKNVCRPFTIPEDWTRFTAFDYGLDMTACLWFAYPPDRSRLYVYRELYKPNLVLSEAACQIRELTGNEKIRWSVASPDLAGRRQDSGKTGFDIMSSFGLCGVMPADNTRITGWRMIRELLRDRSDGEPRLMFFESCTNIIRTLPKLTFDPRVSEDVADSPHELTHAPDALRYGVMSMGFIPGEVRERAVPDVDPFAEWREKKPVSYVRFLES